MFQLVTIQPLYSVGTNLYAMCCDLIDDLFKLEENNIQVVCAASNWKRLPRINPEEVTQISMANKLAQLESKFSFYDAALIDVKSMSSSMDVRIKNIEKGNTKECPLIISNGRSDPTDINDTTAPQTVVKSDTYSDVVSRRERRTYRNQTDRSRTGSDFNKRTRNNGYPDMKDGSNNSGYRRRSGFMGKSSTGVLRAGPLPVRDFFVSRIQKEEGVEEVRAHMSGHNIMARDIVAKNNPDSKFNSFKVSVNVVDAEKFNNPDVWPVGVCVRRWRSFDKQT